MAFKLKSGNNTSFKTMGNSPLQARDPRISRIKEEYKETKPIRPKGELATAKYLGGEHETARTKVPKEERKQYRAEKKEWRRQRRHEIKPARQKRNKNIVKDIGKGVKRYVKQVQGKVKPRGWCPKGGKCGGGPGVQRPSLARRLWPFPSLREGGSK